MSALLQPKPFAELFHDRRQLARAFESIHKTIADSFDAGHPGHMRQITQAEVKRRFAICERWFRDLRGAKQWTIDRVLSALPQALRAELEGRTYEPDSRSLWLPQDGQVG